MISLYYWLQKLRFNRTACQRAAIKMSDSIAPDMTCGILFCLIIQSVIVKKSRNVLLSHYVSTSFYTLYDIV